MTKRPPSEGGALSRARGKQARKSVTITDALFSRICLKVASGRSLRSVVQGKGMPAMSKFFELLEKDPDKGEQYLRARQRGIDVHIDSIIDLADTATAENAHAVRVQVDARKWIASKLVPKVYGDRQQLEISVGDDLGERLRRARERVIDAEPGADRPQTRPRIADSAIKPALPHVLDDADYAALPAGSVFVDPEGEEREKP